MGSTVAPIEGSSGRKRKDLAKCLKLSKNLIRGAAFLVLMGLLLVQAYKCVKQYLQDPTFFATKFVEQRFAAFPAITVCPEDDGYKEEVLKAHGFARGIKDYNKDGPDLTWSSNKTGVTERQLFDLATYRPEELFERIYVRMFQADRNGSFSTQLDIARESTGQLPAQFSEQRHRRFGKCYTVHPEPWMRHLGIYYIKMEFLLDVKLYFHNFGQFLDLSGRMGYKVFMGESIQSQVSYEDINLLEGHDDEGEGSILFLSLDHSDEGHHCAKVDYDDCMYSSLERIMVEEHGCVAPYIRSNKSVCTDPGDINGTFWIAWNRVTNQFKDCPIPCETLVVSLGAKNTKKLDSNSNGTAFFYFPPRIARSEENHFYSFLSMMAEVGGYVGLLLGFSLFHLAQWVGDILSIKIDELEAEEERGGEGEPLKLSKIVRSAKSGRRRIMNSAK